MNLGRQEEIPLKTVELRTPLDDKQISNLESGDKVFLSGEIYTARDAAHKRLVELIENGGELPFDLKGAVIYYVGPAPARPGQVMNSAGPTTSYRMDVFTPLLLEHGLKGTIGKGPRSIRVRESMVENRGVYFAAVGGAAAGIASSVRQAEVIAYDDLGPEAIRRLVVERMPLFVVNDTKGNDLFEQGVAEYRRED
ncbi:MAG: Fe-S-containing hydro-lyase [Candidatus Fermentibacteraceae bacterium]|nr:Fe-S-containing hydro-lyase [Candidatus Fermentibacteraceae bacterium]MBN2608378.1 Fe-S-containing hydro-lyase [Candidatus Fermentibacteraceae bacterium]